MINLAQRKHSVRAWPWSALGHDKSGRKTPTTHRFPLDWLSSVNGSSLFETRPGIAQDSRFPLGWSLDTDSIPANNLDRRLHWALMVLLAVMGMGLVLGVSVMWESYRSHDTDTFAGPHTFWIVGTIERLDTSPSGSASMTVVAENGKSVTVDLDFNRTAVFQKNGLLNISHLRLMQHVNLMHEKGVAKSIEIIHQPQIGIRW